jgi:hypothetical protein
MDTLGGTAARGQGNLGLNQPISRRDFLNGVLLTGAGRIARCSSYSRPEPTSRFSFFFGNVSLSV